MWGIHSLVHPDLTTSHPLCLTVHTFMFPGRPQRHLSLHCLLPCFQPNAFPSYSKMVQWRIGLTFLGNKNGSLSSIQLWKYSTPSEKSLHKLIHFIEPKHLGMLLWGKETPSREASVASPVCTSGRLCKLIIEFFCHVTALIPSLILFTSSDHPILPFWFSLYLRFSSLLVQ